ncbi:hypothetical protein P3T24_007883 [Paraburkholderia sp. GAS33]|uniref:hypothetical protein n=1 Tax=Paraburkholderia sp. GAS33 TaxID=3035130 RepID=UPI003D1E1472
MKAHTSAEKLILWLLGHQPATVRQITASGMLNARDARAALEYGMSRGAIEAIRSPAARGGVHVQYRVTGQPLPALNERPAAPAAPSFDGLLSAWDMAITPPVLPCRTSRKFRLTD